MEYRSSGTDIGDIYRYKAIIKHDIKLLEINLNHLIREEVVNKPRMTKTLISLCIKYYVLLCLLKKYVLKDAGYQAIRLSDIDFPLLLKANLQQPESLTSSSQLEEIKSLRFELLNAKCCENEIATIEKIISGYLTLYYDWSEERSDSECGVTVSEEESVCLEGLTNQQLIPFVNAIIDLFSLQRKHYVTLSKEVKQFSSRFKQVSAKRVEQLLAPFRNSVITDFIQQLYVVSESPQQLYSNCKQTARLLSLQSRASLLYQSIVIYFNWLKQIAQQNNKMVKQASVIGIDEMPQGVRIVVDSGKRSTIEKFLKNVNAVQIVEDDFIESKLIQIENSFKYWFNPNRFVDAIVAIEQRIKTDLKLTMVNGNYQQFIVEEIQKISTARCIHFYGNFSNKDVNYLMRTLRAVTQGYPFDWLPTLSNSDKELCLHVYCLIEVMMKSISLVLNARGIKTEAYSYTKPKDCIKPGRRNKNCILHLLNIYSSTSTKDSSHLDNLFDKLEAF